MSGREEKDIHTTKGAKDTKGPPNSFLPRDETVSQCHSDYYESDE